MKKKMEGMHRLHLFEQRMLKGSISTPTHRYDGGSDSRLLGVELYGCILRV